MENQKLLEENLKLKEIGVTDSKKLSRKNILDLYCEIEKLNIKQESIVLTPFSYNKLYQDNLPNNKCKYLFKYMEINTYNYNIKN